MKKRTVGAVVGATVSVLVPLTLLQVTSAGAVGKVNQQDQTGAITIHSWLYAVPSENVMSATIWDCLDHRGDHR